MVLNGNRKYARITIGATTVGTGGDWSPSF